jgi:Cu(I)/Ag(I) efflux system membrane fusion protein
VLNSIKRTVSVRAEVANPNNRLKPEMLAEGVVSSTLDKGTDQLLVPKSAVLWTGERSVVYVKKPNTEQPTF